MGATEQQRARAFGRACQPFRLKRQHLYLSCPGKVVHKESKTKKHEGNVISLYDISKTSTCVSGQSGNGILPEVFKWVFLFVQMVQKSQFV